MRSVYGSSYTLVDPLTNLTPARLIVEVSRYFHN